MPTVVAIKRFVVSSLGVSAAALALSLVPQAHAQDAVQWRVEDGGNGHWYRISASATAWATAAANANSVGAVLADIESEQEDVFIARLWTVAGLTDGAWAGGYQTNESCGPNCGWAWISGKAWSYTNWYTGEPNDFSGPETRLELLPVNSAPKWYDAPDSTSYVRRSVLEWSADCNLDGIVDYGQCRDGTLPDYDGNNIPDCCERGEACVVGSYPVQWKVSEGGNGHWYRLVFDGHPSWTEAKQLAEQLGGYLATLTSKSENDLGGVLSRGATAMLLGGFQDRASQDYSEPAGGWRWITGEPWTFTNWGSGEPNDANNGHGDPGEDYLSSWTGGQGFRWGDGDNICPECNPGPFLVEWSADCNSDGIVDYGQILQGQLVDSDQNGVPDVCEVHPCPGDVTNGGSVDATDLSVILAAWGTNGQGEFDADADNSGLVDGGDLALVLSGWGPCRQ
jgi:hypothetical protein